MSEIAWPACRCDTANLIRTRDWSTSSLGPLQQWPGTLRILVEVVLRAPVGMALVWGDDRTLIYNDAYAAIAGGRHPRVFGMPVRDAWPEAWEDFNKPVHDACFAGEVQTFQDKHFVLDRDGTPKDVWFDLYYTPAVDEHGQVRGVLATVIETTARVCGEQQRRRQEEHLTEVNASLDALRLKLEQANRQLAGDMDFLNELFRQAPSFMAVVTGPDHVFELANDSYLRLVQHRDILGKPVRQALPEVVEQGFVALLDQVYREGEPFYGQNVEVQLECGGGEAMERRVLDFVYQPLKDTNGEVCGVFIEGIDITEHALTEEWLRVAQEAGEIGTFEWYPATGQMKVSEAYRRLWGFDADTEITAELLVGRIEPSHRHLLGPSRLGNEDNPIAYAEYQIRRADTGEQRWLARRGQPVSGTLANQRRYLGVAYDITDRKRTEDNLRRAEAALRELNQSLERKVVLEETERVKAEDALRQAHKMEAVGQLASGVAHDFNNVLQIISSNLQLMEIDGMGELSASRVASAIAAVERGSKLSSQLLAFARRQPLQPVATHLGRLIGDMDSLLLRALGDRIEVDIQQPAGLWNVEVDRNPLENAILTRVINARDAMSGGGRLSISLATAALEDAAGDQVCLAITDTGCGMPPDVVQKIFDPFYTTKAPGQGTGLGMSMVYGFVKQSGGEIRIQSQPGQGTTILIYLPRSHGDVADAHVADDATVLGVGETILVVDDDAAVVAATTDMLASLGYHVLRAGDAQQALAVLQSGVHVDLLFSDLSMPGSVDCATLVDRCRDIAPHCAILLTSGHLPDKAIEAGIDLLPKPYSREQLARAIHQQLDIVAPALPSPVSPAGAALEKMPAGRRILVVEDDTDTRELACELLAALGHDARGSDSAEQALSVLNEREVDVLFTDLNLPGMSGIELAARAIASHPALKVILASGEGKAIQLPADSGIIVLPKPYDLLQLEDSIAHAAMPATTPLH